MRDATPGRFERPKRIFRATVPLVVRKRLARLLGRRSWLASRHWWVQELLRDYSDGDPNAYHRFLWAHHLAYAETYEAGLRFGPWLTLEAGPHVRAYVTPAGTERWVLWEGQARAAVQVIRPGGWVYLRVGRVLAADIPGMAFDHGQGADAGLELRLGGTPLWGHVGYWVHRASASGALRVETVQGMSLGVALRRGETP